MSQSVTDQKIHERARRVARGAVKLAADALRNGDANPGSNHLSSDGVARMATAILEAALRDDNDDFAEAVASHG